MIKITSLEAENVKRIRAVELHPTESGLTVIGGDNAQGKTSVLDAIAWALGGNKYAPTNPQREGSVTPPEIKIELSNGLIVERRGKNSELKITDPTGRKNGQKILDELIGTLALDLPKFMESSTKEKADTLLRIIGVEQELYKLESDYKNKYIERREVGRIAESKKKFADGMPSYPDAPEELVSAQELINRNAQILAKNGENQRLRQNADYLIQKLALKSQELIKLQQEVDDLREQTKIATDKTKDLVDESTKEIEEELSNIDAINSQVRANLEKERAEDEARVYLSQYDDLTKDLEVILKAKAELLNGADLPLEGLTVEEGELKYKGQPWDGMSSAEQLKVACAIVRKVNPECGFVLMDELEKMDIKTMNEFGSWAEQEGLQIIATRVSKGSECTLIIEDGRVLENNKNWTKGVF